MPANLSTALKFTETDQKPRIMCGFNSLAAAAVCAPAREFPQRNSEGFTKSLAADIKSKRLKTKVVGYRWADLGGLVTSIN